MITITIDPLVAFVIVALVALLAGALGWEQVEQRRRHDRLRAHVQGHDRQLVHLQWTDTAPPMSAAAEMARVSRTIALPGIDADQLAATSHRLAEDARAFGVTLEEVDTRTMNLAAIRPPSYFYDGLSVTSLLRHGGRLTCRTLAIELHRPRWDVQQELNILEADGIVTRERTFGTAEVWSLATVGADHG